MTEEYRLSYVGGGKVLPHGSLYARDGHHLIVPFNNQLKVYFITTRQSIKSIKFSNVLNLDNLVEMKQDINNPDLLWVFLETGEILIVNWREKMIDPVLKRLQLSKNDEDSLLKIVSFSEESLTAILGKKSSNPHTRTIVQYNLSDESLKSVTLTSIKNVVLFNVSNDFTKLAFISQPNTSKIITLVDLNDTSKNKTIPFGYKATISSLAVSDDSLIAVGTTYGIIHLLYENTSRLLKWHIDQVNTLSFSKDSNYLLSGGLEKVLVFWQLDTEKQQFLPRLNGEIVNVENSTDDYYTLTLRTDDQNNYELLVLSTLDLQSRLVVSGPRQILNTDPSTLKKSYKFLQKREDPNSIKLKDFTSVFRLHPTTKEHLYFSNGTSLQVFDTTRQEQSFTQKITDTLQTGKVKSETKLLDPIIKDFTFTVDGKWLATVEEHHHGEIDNLLSKNDLTYIMKIWKATELQTKQTSTTQASVENSWELVTKIVNPHGLHIPVLKIIPAPAAYFKGIAFLTADNNGGVRLWRPTGKNEKRPTWSLRKLKPSSGIFSNSISLTWSKDASLIFLGFDSVIVTLDIDTFEEIETPDTQILTNISGARIRFLDIVDNNLIILTKTCLKSINLLTMEENDLSLKVNSPKAAENLICVNHNKNLIAIAVNYYNPEESKATSKIFVFTPYSKIPVYSVDYQDYISSLTWNLESGFVFIDINSKIGAITTSKVAAYEREAESIDYAQEMSILLQEAQSSSQIYKKSDELDNTDEINGQTKGLDINTFNSLFESINSIKLDTLFERVVQIVD